jgi:uncharacterized protein
MSSKRRTIFLGFTFALTWITHWLLAYLTNLGILTFDQPLGQVFFIVGGSAPTIGAYVAVLLTQEKGDIQKFHSRVFKLNLGLRWYLITLLTPILLGFLGVLFGYLFNQGYLLENPIKPLYMFIPAFFFSIILGGIEELGWRGILLPELLKTSDIFSATSMTGIAWGLWHLPLFFVIGTGHYGGSILIFVLSAIALSCFLSWMYIKTESVFLCVLFHTSVNAAGSLGLGFPREEMVAYLVDTVVILVLGGLLLWTIAKKPESERVPGK